MSVNWVETLGSPKIGGNGTTERIYTALPGKGIELLNSYTDGSLYNDGYFRKEQSTVQGGIYETVTLVFTSTLAGSITAGERTTYEATNTPTARDIRLNPNYRTNWRYNLYGYVKKSDGTFPPLPFWWSTATDLTIPSADAGNYAWGESTPAADANGEWVVLAERTMTADTYPYPAPTVVETVYVGSESRASDLLQASGTCRTPGKTFGYTSSSRYWQITGSNISKQANKWLVRTTYQYAPAGWDGRIIPGGMPDGGDL